MPPTHVTITADDVRRWVAERDELWAEAKELTRKIDAASVFMPGLVVQIAKIDLEDGSPATMPDWVELVVAESDTALSPKDIRARIEAKGQKVVSENYIYTAIKRATDRGQIVKTQAGYVSPNRSSKEETPDHEAGGPQAVLTLSGGSVGAAPEAGGT